MNSRDIRFNPKHIYSTDDIQQALTIFRTILYYAEMLHIYYPCGMIVEFTSAGRTLQLRATDNIKVCAVYIYIDNQDTLQIGTLEVTEEIIDLEQED